VSAASRERSGPVAGTEAERRVVVIGGGLAGISAAVSLADRGWRVTLLERRPRLGGAVYSFDRAGLTVDTGVHVILRCYRRYRSLLRRMGVADRVPIQPRMTIAVLRPAAPAARLTRGRYWPSPAHLVPALAGYRELSVGERAAALRAALAFSRLDDTDAALDGIPLGRWLCRHGQSPHLIEALWGLLCVAALNIDPADASTALMARVVHMALFEHAPASDIAVPAAPLATLHDAPARRLLGRLGVTVATGTKATGIERRGSRYRVDTADGPVRADAVVTAVPHRHAATLVPADACPGRDRWAGLACSPIVNVHLRFDRAVTGPAIATHGFAAVLGSPLQWVFDRTSAAGLTGQYLVSSVSAADTAVRTSTADLLAVARRELARLFPSAHNAREIDGFVTREPHATFRQQAGSAVLRPPAATSWPGLVLAGAWTATGLPDTLEGAVYSGQLAARELGGPGLRPGMARSTLPDRSAAAARAGHPATEVVP
jgi:squalene-associated FAD-dependent desaturase